LSEGVQKRLPLSITMPPSQVIGHQVNNHGRKHQEQPDPDTPITMRTSPVRTMAMMNTVAMRTAVIALYLIH